MEMERAFSTEEKCYYCDKGIMQFLYLTDPSNPFHLNLLCGTNKNKVDWHKFSTAS